MLLISGARFVRKNEGIHRTWFWIDRGSNNSVIYVAAALISYPSAPWRQVAVQRKIRKTTAGARCLAGLTVVGEGHERIEHALEPTI